MNAQRWESNSYKSVLRGDGFYISYNRNPGMGFSLFSGDDGSDETALCHEGKFYILNGDHRDQYTPLAEQGFGTCLAYFLEHRERCQSSWSVEPDLVRA